MPAAILIADDHAEWPAAMKQLLEEVRREGTKKESACVDGQEYLEAPPNERTRNRPYTLSPWTRPSRGEGPSQEVGIRAVLTTAPREGAEDREEP